VETTANVEKRFMDCHMFHNVQEVIDCTKQHLVKLHRIYQMFCDFQE
jgi:hypothetical protein